MRPRDILIPLAGCAFGLAVGYGAWGTGSRAGDTPAPVDTALADGRRAAADEASRERIRALEAELGRLRSEAATRRAQDAAAQAQDDVETSVSPQPTSIDPARARARLLDLMRAKDLPGLTAFMEEMLAAGPAGYAVLLAFMGMADGAQNEFREAVDEMEGIPGIQMMMMSFLVTHKAAIVEGMHWAILQPTGADGPGLPALQAIVRGLISVEMGLAPPAMVKAWLEEALSRPGRTEQELLLLGDAWAKVAPTPEVWSRFRAETDPARQMQLLKLLGERGEEQAYPVIASRIESGENPQYYLLALTRGVTSPTAGVRIQHALVAIALSPRVAESSMGWTVGDQLSQLPADRKAVLAQDMMSGAESRPLAERQGLYEALQVLGAPEEALARLAATIPEE